jgi:hypothetical protein
MSMLEVSEAVIKNGQSRDTGNNGNTRCKTTTNTTQKTKKMSNMDPTKKTGNVTMHGEYIRNNLHDHSNQFPFVRQQIYIFKCASIIKLKITI